MWLSLQTYVPLDIAGIFNHCHWKLLYLLGETLNKVYRLIMTSHIVVNKKQILFVLLHRLNYLEVWYNIYWEFILLCSILYAPLIFVWVCGRGWGQFIQICSCLSVHGYVHCLLSWRSAADMQACQSSSAERCERKQLLGNDVCRGNTSSLLSPPKSCVWNSLFIFIQISFIWRKYS